MKYLVLRKRPELDENPFTELVAGGTDADDLRFPFEATCEELDDGEAADLRRDDRTEDLYPSLPFTLIAPVEGDLEYKGLVGDGTVASDRGGRITWGLKAVKAETSPQDGSGVTVAILDTGIDLSHPVFSGLNFPKENLMDFVINEEGVAGSAPDHDGHGTHVAGTIVGREVDGIRIGVAPGVTRVLIGKVVGPKGGSTMAIYNAIEWARRRNADVISMSLGIDFRRAVNWYIEHEDLPPDIAASRALEAYRANSRLFDRLAGGNDAFIRRGGGALLVAASGNSSLRKKNPKYTVNASLPAGADGFISVGAVGPTSDPSQPFVVADFSNTGCLLSAPGVSVLSAARGGGLVAWNGTSMATPHVAGAIALWIQKKFPRGERPKDWAQDVQRLLESHVFSDAGQARSDFGLGVVQAPQ